MDEDSIEHRRVHNVVEGLDNASLKVFWSFLIFWILLGLATVWWLYEYVYTPVSTFWN